MMTREENVYPLMRPQREEESPPAEEPVQHNRLEVAYAWIRTMDLTGMTWHDLAETTGWHHGQASSALTTLHKRGRIKRLHTTRDRCHVYVAPEFVGDRPLDEPRLSVNNQMLADAIEILRGTDWCGLHSSTLPQPDTCQECKVIDLVTRYDRREGR